MAAWFSTLLLLRKRSPFLGSLAYGRHGRLGYGAAVLFVFTTSVHSSILGALMTFAPTVWYRSYAVQAAQWSLSPLEDQQLGGLLMWVPAGVLLLVLGLGLFAAWLGEAEQRVKHTSSHTPRRLRVSEPG